MHRRSFPLPSQDYSTQVIRPPVSSHNSGQETDNPDQVKDQSTQTNPITITINIYPSGQKPPHLKGPAADNLAIDHSKLKNPALESVIAQSPQVSGVLAPPSTPEIPNHEIAQMIANAIDDLPPEVFSSLGDSRFAPRRSVSPRKSPGNIASSVSKDHVYSSLNKQLSPVERKAKEESFTRMSFKAADTDPTLVDDKLLKSAFINDVQNSKWADKPPKRTPPAPISIGTAHARTNPFSVLSDSVDMKADSVVFSNVRSNADGAEEAAATKENVTVETSIPPHLRPVAKSSRASVSTDAEFVQLADKLELSDSTYGQDDTKVANKEPSKQPASAEPEISGSNLHSMFHLPGPRAPLPIKAPKVATLQSASPMRSAFENPTSSSVSPSTQDMSALTPSSVEFKTASPPKTASGVTNDENLQGALFFKAWPKLEDRKKPGMCLNWLFRSMLILSSCPDPQGNDYRDSVAKSKTHSFPCFRWCSRPFLHKRNVCSCRFHSSRRCPKILRCHPKRGGV